MARQFRTEQIKEPRPRVVLPDAFYYLSNFETVLATLHQRYADLWSDEERQFLATFAGLPKASRALLVRMVMREGVLFRGSRLKYPEIGETAAAVVPLVRAGWVDDVPNLDIDQLQRLITKEELLRLAPRYRNLTKPDLVAMLRAQCPNSQSFQAWCRDSSDRVYELLAAPLCERFRLMFFGNFHQDWSEFVLRDVGIFAYEKIPSSQQSRAFSSRGHLDAFEQLFRCGQRLDSGMAWDEVAAAIPGPIADSEWLERQRQRLLFQIGQAAERAGDPRSALTVYSTCTHRGAVLRTIRLLERSEEREIARDLCLAALGTSQNEAELEQLGRLLPRLNRKLGVAAKSPRRPPKVPAFEIVIDKPSDAAVEYCALNHLKQAEEGHTTLHYVENGLVNSLFGLLCWKAIFAPIAGAFFHEFQDGPADLSSGEFYERRREEFSECLAELESGQYRATMRRIFAEKAGIQSPFVAWRLLSRTLLESALTCIPAAHLRVWFEWIVRDVRDNRAGFPDLVQFWLPERRYRMIEVKGPGDRLQDNQRRLLEYCVSRQMPVSVCHVRWAES